MEPKNEQIGQNNPGNATDDWENVAENGHNDVEPVHAAPPAPMAVPESEKVSLSAEAPADTDEETVPDEVGAEAPDEETVPTAGATKAEDAPEEVMDEVAEAAAEEKDAAIGSQAMKINLGTPADAPENTDGDTAEQVETEGQDEPDEDYPRMEIKPYIEKGLREGRLQKVKAEKFGRILAERGTVGQEVISWSVNPDGTENDEKRAKIESSDSEWIFTKADDDGEPIVDANGHKNQWIAKDRVLNDKYEEDPEHPGVYKPKGQAQIFVETDRPMTLVQWGEEMKMPAGSMINVTNPDDMYGVNPRDFEDTYRIVGKIEEAETDEEELAASETAAAASAAETDEDGEVEKTPEKAVETDETPTEVEKNAEKTEMSMEDKLAAHWQVVDRRAMEGEGIERDIYGERVDNTSEVIYLDELEQYSQEQEALRLEQQESERRENLHESLVKAPRTRDLTPEERDFFYEVYGVWPD